jgi:hypothetical protein
MLLLLFGMYYLLYLPVEHHILYIILFIPYVGFVINKFRKIKKNKTVILSKNQKITTANLCRYF